MKLLFSILSLFIGLFGFGQSKYEKDFNQFCELVQQHYAYLGQQKINLDKIKEIYATPVKSVSNNREFIKFLEEVVNEFHNGHISLNTNLPGSGRMVPSGQDLYIERINSRFYITDIRKGYGAELAGLKTGDEIIAFNGKPVEEQAKQFLPKYTNTYNNEMWLYALNKLLAGTHDMKRKITVVRKGQQTDHYPDSLKIISTKAVADHKILNPNTAYIKINNSLGDYELIPEFDKLVDQYLHYKNLVIDLTETPGGGNSTVARGMMGRFISKNSAYQKHEIDESRFDTKRMWIEHVSPRKKQFKGNVYILVGRWTGSMGEGIAIGFDGMRSAKIIGTKMAGLIGAIEGFKLAETGIGFQIPTERLYHINGTPRENYVPGVHTKDMNETYKKLGEIK